MQNYSKNLNYQTFYQKNNEKTFFLLLFDVNQGKNDKNEFVSCVRKQIRRLHIQTPFFLFLRDNISSVDFQFIALFSNMDDAAQW